VTTELLLSERQRESLRDDGFAVVDLGLTESEVARPRDEILRLWRKRCDDLAATAPGAADFTRARPELPRMHRESELLTSFCLSEPFVALAIALFGDDADLSWNQAHIKAPGSDERTAIPWHQDGFYAETDSTERYSCWVALTPATIQNGAMWGARLSGRPMLPHAWNEKLSYFACEIDDATAFPLEVRPGQAVLFDTRFPHKSGVNHGDSVRVGYSLSISAPGIRLKSSGEAFGDQLALVRAGRPARDVLLDHANAHRRGERDAAHPGARLLEALRSRLEARADDVEALFARCVRDLEANDVRAAEATAERLLALAPDDVVVNGDLLRARTRVPQILFEATTVYRRGDLNGARLLLRRALELDPGNAAASRALALLPEDRRR
jgi:ectoine hydroxylase-related dioxygenase (phytanoyl-CoA dioxygenase family)